MPQTPLRADGGDPTPLQIELMLAFKGLGYKTEAPRAKWGSSSICMTRPVKGQVDVMEIGDHYADYKGRLERVPD